METMLSSDHALISTDNSMQLGIDIAALFVGALAVATVIRISRRLGGRVKEALRYFTIGITSNIAAIVWSLFFGHSYMVAGFHIDVHQNLMSIGLIFFIISAIKFSKIVQNV